MTITTLMYPLQATDIGQVVAYGRIAERFQVRLWIGQSMQIETHTLFSYLCGMGVNASFGTSVVLTPLRHPYLAAVEARSIAALSGQPFTAGFGPSGSGFQAGIYGKVLRKPVAETGEFVGKVRALLDGGQITAALPDAPSIELLPLDTPPVEVGMGVLRPAMATEAGRRADSAITWLTPASWIDGQLIPAARKGAEEFGRPTPRFVVVVQVAVTRPGRDMQRIAFFGTRQHLSLPHYVNMLQQSGLPVVHGDPETSSKALLDGGVVVTGSPEEIAEQLSAWHDAGADEVILNTSGVLVAAGLGEALRDADDILAAVAARDGR
jgi:alkanesulfonate monooxygenase SsuD/methylene tetrahydromethanopterin reductase-like flavin-dependent oxidoreductase (luciferase family)